MTQDDSCIGWLAIAAKGLLMLFVAATPGCVAYTIDKGDIHVSGFSVLTDKGIQKASIDGLGTVEGYSANPNAEAIKAATEGAVSGAVKGLKP